MAVHADSHKRLTKEVFLGLADGMVTTVIDQENLDRHLVVDDGLQLLNVHLNAALTGQQDNIMFTVAVPLKLRIMAAIHAPMAAGRS